jgi:hypothetical protein
MKKKLVSPRHLLLNEEFDDKQAQKGVQKNFEKSEKKTCQGHRNLISLSKPNQTNGETND